MRRVPRDLRGQGDPYTVARRAGRCMCVTRVMTMLAAAGGVPK